MILTIIKYFTAATIHCGWQKIKSMFRVLGIYGKSIVFDKMKKKCTLVWRKKCQITLLWVWMKTWRVLLRNFLILMLNLFIDHDQVSFNPKEWSKRGLELENENQLVGRFGVLGGNILIAVVWCLQIRKIVEFLWKIEIQVLDKFLLAVESPDLSQADKSNIRVSSFPKLCDG